MDQGATNIQLHGPLMTPKLFSHRWLKKFFNVHFAVRHFARRLKEDTFMDMLFDDSLLLSERGLDYLAAFRVDAALHGIDISVELCEYHGKGKLQYAVMLSQTIQDLVVMTARSFRRIKWGYPVYAGGFGRLGWQNYEYSDQVRMTAIINRAAEDFGEFDVEKGVTLGWRQGW